MKRVILIVGKKGAGKSTYAKKLKHLSMYHGTTVEIIPFASSIKNITSFIEKETGISMDTHKESVYRKIMQVIGQQFRDNVDKNFWIDDTIKRVRNSEADIVVIDDCRFINEFNAFDDFNDVVKIKIKGEGYGKDNDVSETEMDSIKEEEFDYLVEPFNHNVDFGEAPNYVKIDNDEVPDYIKENGLFFEVV